MGTQTIASNAGEPRSRRWTRDEYHRAADLGVFGPAERLELIDGEVLKRMSPVGSPHSTCVRRVHAHLIQAFGDGHVVSEQQPITLADSSEPEPDISVAVGTIDDYEERHPGPKDIALVVEVSDSSLGFDRGRKALLYSEAGISEYWILDINARQLEAYRDPRTQSILQAESLGLPLTEIDTTRRVGYRTVTTYGEADSIIPLGAPGATIRVLDLFPRKR